MCAGSSDFLMPAMSCIPVVRGMASGAPGMHGIVHSSSIAAPHGRPATPDVHAVAARFAELSQAREHRLHARILDVSQLPREQRSCLAAALQSVLACSGTAPFALPRAGDAQSMRKADAKSLEHVRASPRVYSQLGLQDPVRSPRACTAECEQADFWRPGGDFAPAQQQGLLDSGQKHSWASSECFPPRSGLVARRGCSAWPPKDWRKWRVLDQRSRDVQHRICVDELKIGLLHVRTEIQRGDLFTKCLDKTAFLRHRRTMLQ